MGIFSSISRGLGFNQILGPAQGILGDITGANQAADAAQAAAATQSAAAQAGIAEQRRQFDLTRGSLSPFIGAGVNALSAQGDLLGLNGPEKQAAALAALQGSPEFSSLLSSGENAILQNASATGGLRGGNVQSALAQFRPALLSQTINSRLSNLGGLTTLGQNAAAGAGTIGANSANTISQLLQQQGAATAGGQLAAGAVPGQIFGTLLQGAGVAAGSGLFSDRRLKKNIQRIGTHPSGLPKYRWTYLWGEPSEGVMADEAQAAFPEAVFEGPGGYLMVDYSKL